METLPPFDKAATAAALGITYQAVAQWKVVPDGRVLAVSRANDWSPSPHQLRPDLYPHPDDGLPVELRGKGAQALPACDRRGPDRREEDRRQDERRIADRRGFERREHARRAPAVPGVAAGEV